MHALSFKIVQITIESIMNKRIYRRRYTFEKSLIKENGRSHNIGSQITSFA